MLLALSASGAGIISLAYLYRKRFERSCGTHDETNEIEVSGKIVIITGCNTGLGKEAAYELAKRGAIVIMANRDEKSTSQAITEIRKRTSNGELVFMKLDLSNLESVRKFAEEFSSKYDKLHILINNAGVFVPLSKRVKNQDGHEINFAVNHLGHFLLTNLLLDKLKNAGPGSRIVIVASLLSRNGKLNFDDLTLEKGDPNDKFLAYGTSKQANILFARQLAVNLSGSGVHTYALCPGWCKTDLNRNSDLTWKSYLMMFPFAFLFMRSATLGNQTILHCALSKSCENETGKCYRDCDHWVPPPNIKDGDAKKLWEVSEKLTGLQQRT